MNEMYPECTFHIDSDSLYLEYDVPQETKTKINVDIASLLFTLSIIIPCALISG